MSAEIIVGGTYRHYKGPLYRVLGMVRHSETLESMVYYECLYENEGGRFWVRPAKMWGELIEYEGKKMARFTLVEAIA